MSTSSYWGTHPTGRRYYTRSKTGAPLVFAVFRLDRGKPSTTYKGGEFVVLPAKPQWVQVRLVEDRPYPNELTRVNGSYVPLGRDMTPREYADEVAVRYREVIGCEAMVVALKPSGVRS